MPNNQNQALRILNLGVDDERAKALKSDLEYYKKAVKEMERQEKEGLNAK